VFPRLEEINATSSPNSHQLQSFFISNCSSIDEPEDFPSRSPGMEEDLGSCYHYLKGNVHQPYFELVSLFVQTLQ